MPFNLGAAVQDILTRGLDVAQAAANVRFHVNDPAGNVTGPNGTTAQVGQPTGGVAGVVASVPTWAWIAGAAALVFVLVLRK